MKTTTITCDQCKADIQYTGYQNGYRILLTLESKSTYGGFVYSMNERTDRKMAGGPKHFCNLKCLVEWLDPAVNNQTSPPGDQ